MRNKQTYRTKQAWPYILRKLKRDYNNLFSRLAESHYTAVGRQSDLFVVSSLTRLLTGIGVRYTK